MGLQFTQSGDALANNVTTGVSFQNALLPATITCWINAPWTGAGAQSYVGLYDENQRITSGNNTSTAIQLGCRATNTFNVWTWGGGLLNTSSISMAPYVNQWVFIAYTFDGTIHRCYVNGILADSTTATQRSGNFDRVYLNGYTNGGANETETFKLDTYNYYSRTLSVDEILTMYTSKGNRHGIVHNISTRYEFDGGSIGSNVVSIPNLTTFNPLYSNLIPVVPAGTTPVSYIAGYASGNLRPGI